MWNVRRSGARFKRTDGIRDVGFPILILGKSRMRHTRVDSGNSIVTCASQVIFKWSAAHKYVSFSHTESDVTLHHESVDSRRARPAQSAPEACRRTKCSPSSAPSPPWASPRPPPSPSSPPPPRSPSPVSGNEQSNVVVAMELTEPERQRRQRRFFFQLRLKTA